jgi:hypothetical protein
MNDADPERKCHYLGHGEPVNWLTRHVATSHNMLLYSDNLFFLADCSSKESVAY